LCWQSWPVSSVSSDVHPMRSNIRTRAELMTFAVANCSRHVPEPRAVVELLDGPFA
jgi:hypothetical protein